MMTLLVLGGASKSLPLVHYARSQGHAVVLCDRDPNNPCRPLCDQFIPISTAGPEPILDALGQQPINGVVAFGSDVNAVSAAHIAAALSLPGNPPSAVEAMVRKDLFRQALGRHGFAAPNSHSFTAITEVAPWRDQLQPPLIVKPADAAGSAGVSRLDSWAALPSVFAHAQQASRQGRVVIETFIERSHPHLIGGDIFVLDGQVQFWGLLNSHRACPQAPFLPTGTSYPLALDQHQQQAVRHTLQQLVSDLGLCMGGFNVELMFDQQGRLHVIELAPRNGGNQIPELLQLATGVNLIHALVDASLGQQVRLTPQLAPSYVANVMVHSISSGRFQQLLLDDSLTPYLLRRDLSVEPGDPVCAFKRATDALGTLTFRFPCHAEQQALLNSITELVTVVVDPD